MEDKCELCGCHSLVKDFRCCFCRDEEEEEAKPDELLTKDNDNEDST